MAALILTGHHGTSRKIADAVLSDGFKISRNTYDWLGDGAYFWQEAPIRALEWAHTAFGADGVVLEASIEIRDFINLLDTEWMSWLADVYDQYLREQKAAGRTLPVQTDKSHRLDREVINFGVSILEESGIPVRGVIGAFREGRPVFTNSALFTQSHVQIAVRDLSLVANCRILSPKEIPDVRQIKNS